MIEIAVIGAGMGSWEQLTLEAAEKIAQADYILGSARLLPMAARWGKPVHTAVTLEQVQQILAEQQGRRVVILVSGDVGFYSAAANYSKLPDCRGAALSGYFLGQRFLRQAANSLGGRPLGQSARLAVQFGAGNCAPWQGFLLNRQ